MQRRTTCLFVSWLLIFMLALAGCGETNQGTSPAIPDQVDSAANLPSETTEEATPAIPSEEEEAEGPTTGSTSDGEPDNAAPEELPVTSDTTDNAAPSGAKVEIAEQSDVAGQLQVHFIDVGQGASQLIIGPTGRTMLIDGGDNDMEETVVAYLREQGISKVDILIGTHPHADHIGGLDAVVDNFDIGKIYMPRVQANTRTFESLLLAIQQKGLKVTTAKAGLALDWEPDVDVNIVAPVDTYDNMNDMSAVVHLTFGNTSFLFTGDAEAASEADILDSGATIKADVLMIGHHGSSTSTTRAFLEKVAPTYGVIQVGENSYGHPHKEVLNLLSGQGVHIFRNDEQGNIVFISDGNHITVEQNPWTYRPATPASAQRPETSEAEQSDHHETGKKDAVGALTVTADIDNANPAQNSQVTVTVIVIDADGNPVQGAEVSLLLHYKSTKTTYEGTTDASGKATLPFRIGRAAKDFTVEGEITVAFGDRRGTAQVSFTPQ